jgi:hypothetical protein
MYSAKRWAVTGSTELKAARGLRAREGYGRNFRPEVEDAELALTGGTRYQ